MIEWQEAGGETLRVEENGKLVWRVPPTTLRGIVRDDSLARPVAGADVQIAGSSGTMTDALGQFVLRDVRLGDVVVQIAPAYTASLGVAPSRRHLLTRGDSSWAELRVPHPRRAVVAACAAAGHPLSDRAERNLLRGIVRDANGGPTGAAEVRITWTDQLAGPENQRGEMRTQSSATGEYVACGLPLDVPLQLRALLDHADVGHASARMSPDAIGVQVDIRPPT